MYVQSPIQITPIVENSLVSLSSQSPLQPPSEASSGVIFFTLVSAILELHVNEIISVLQRKGYLIQHNVSEVHRVFAHTSNLTFFYC